MRQARVWHPEDIKAAVRKRGTTLSKLAVDNGGHESLCRAALKRPSPSGERIISAFLDVPPQQLWPDRYSKDGRRLDPRHVRDGDTAKRSQAHRLIAEAR
ncbi:helix-turn-helix domain-containing protein [Phenylobacterium sp.]|uniref:helix-turn-helix domain-containing protein n=1 Tax=Phenylobacterium sp. TaxID=1871053 RepID=UPI00391A5096